MKEKIRKQVKKHGGTLASYMDTKTARGMRNRYWIAIITTIVAILVDTVMVSYNYQYIPRLVPILSDWDCNVVQWGSKTVFWEYEIQRVALLVGSILIGWLLRRMKPQSAILRRTECLIVETAMLLITTGVGISIATLALVMGDKTQRISDYWETTIMTFWFLLLLVEYITNIVFLHKQAKAPQSNTNS